MEKWIFLLILSATSHAQDLIINYEIPTKRENGTPLKLEDIEKIQFRFIVYYEDLTVDGQHIIKNLPPGDYKFKQRAIDTKGERGDYSDNVEFVHTESNECPKLDIDYKNLTLRQAAKACIDQTFNYLEQTP